MRSTHGRIYRGPENKLRPTLARSLLCHGIDNRHYSETHMNTLSSKLTTFVAALVMNSLIMGAVGFLFEIQSHPHMSVMSFAKAVVAHQWLI
jgi:hypothetical protein